MILFVLWICTVYTGIYMRIIHARQRVISPKQSKVRCPHSISEASCVPLPRSLSPIFISLTLLYTYTRWLNTHNIFTIFSQKHTFAECRMLIRTDNNNDVCPRVHRTDRRLDLIIFILPVRTGNSWNLPNI